MTSPGLVGHDNIPFIWTSRTQTSPIRFVNGSNPVEGPGGVQFQGTRGVFLLIVTDNSSGYVWSLQIQGGQSLDQNTTRVNFYYLRGSAMGCSVTQTDPGVMNVTTPAGDVGGRTYVLTFFAYESVPPYIRKTGGSLLQGDLIVTVTDYSRSTYFTYS